VRRHQPPAAAGAAAGGDAVQLDASEARVRCTGLQSWTGQPVQWSLGSVSRELWTTGRPAELAASVPACRFRADDDFCERHEPHALVSLR